MARIVTRVTSKNFCIVNPSFELEAVTDLEGDPMIQVKEGQACINGMDIIATQRLRIYHPDEAGTYQLALHLWRDSAGNVLGDDTVGVSKLFSGVYLDWWTEKDENDPDALWLGQVTWDGTEFTDIQEDLDKYGRIWAKDILCKIEDWKHPDESRMLLQDWMYKAPDWYVSKEGDVIFGPIEFLAGRDPNVAGTLDDHQDVGSGKYGVRIEAVDGNTTNVIIKAPDTAESATNNLFKITETNTGLTLDLGPNKIESKGTDYNLDITSPNIININATQGANLISPETITIDSTGDKTIIHGQDAVEISSGANNANSKITITDGNIKFSDANSTIGTVDINFTGNMIVQNWGNNASLTTDGSNMTLANTGDVINITTSNASGSAVNMTTKVLNVTGDVRASRVFNAVYNDIAEYMEKADYTENIVAGDVVVFTNEGKVTKASNMIGPDCINRIAGVVSSPDTMGYVLGGDGLADNEKVPVALAGRVYLNIGDLAVQTGDLIALKNDGTLEIVRDYTRAVVGKATKSSANGKVYIMIK